MLLFNTYAAGKNPSQLAAAQHSIFVVIGAD